MGQAVMTGEIRRWNVSDARECVGHVVLDDDGAFVAIDAAGHVVGKFDTCLAASRALDEKQGLADCAWTPSDAIGAIPPTTPRPQEGLALTSVEIRDRHVAADLYTTPKKE
jgi:hypothetical protein